MDGDEGVKEEGWGHFGHLGHRAGGCGVKVHTVGLQVQLEVGAAPQGVPQQIEGPTARISVGDGRLGYSEVLPVSSLLVLHLLHVNTLQHSVLPALHCACDTPVSSSLLGICSRLNVVTPLCILPAPPCCWRLRHPCSSLGLKPLRAPSAWLNPAMPLPPSSLSPVPPPVPRHAALQGPAQCWHLSALEPFVRLSGDGFPSPTHLFTALGQQVWEDSRDVRRAGEWREGQGKGQRL